MTTVDLPENLKVSKLTIRQSAGGGGKNADEFELCLIGQDAQ
jgi:hypothetical protein